jgi:hypothetical protein
VARNSSCRLEIYQETCHLAVPSGLLIIARSSAASAASLPSKKGSGGSAMPAMWSMTAAALAGSPGSAMGQVSGPDGQVSGPPWPPRCCDRSIMSPKHLRQKKGKMASGPHIGGVAVTRGPGRRWPRAILGGKRPHPARQTRAWDDDDMTHPARQIRICDQDCQSRGQRAITTRAYCSAVVEQRGVSLPTPTLDSMGWDGE